MSTRKKIEEGDSSDGPTLSSFQSLAAEGDTFGKQGEYLKAIEVYSKALELLPWDKNALVARSRCHLKLGNPIAALEDAESTLKDDPQFFKGIYMKAEAHYDLGEFETALVQYHQGSFLRPEQMEFRLGIQKACEAIDNAVGDPNDFHFKHAKPKHNELEDSNGRKSVKRGASKFNGNLAKEAAKAHNTLSRQKMAHKNLLGELYEDRKFLDALIHDKNFTSIPNKEVSSLAKDALDYLTMRSDFWGKQKPLYTRNKAEQKALVKTINARNMKAIHDKALDYSRRYAEQQDILNKKETGAKMGAKKTILPGAGSYSPFQIERAVDMAFRQIDRSIEKRDFDTAIKVAKNTLARSYQLQFHPNHTKIFADIHNCLGDIYLQVENGSEALNHYKKAHAAIKESEMHLIAEEAATLGNLGRACVFYGKYNKAAQYFREQLELLPEKSTMEKVCLLHDLGRCNLELGEFDEALYLAFQALSIAHDIDDTRWVLNASILQAQVYAATGEKRKSIEAYNNAQAAATSLKDSSAIIQIKQVLSLKDTSFRPVTAIVSRSITSKARPSRPRPKTAAGNRAVRPGSNLNAEATPSGILVA